MQVNGRFNTLDTEFKILDSDKPLRKFIQRHDRIGLDVRAQFAEQLVAATLNIQFAGLIHGKRVGIDSPETMVSFACDVADEAFKQFKKRGWLATVPGLSELEEDEAEKVGF